MILTITITITIGAADGEALELASEALRADREVVLAAVLNKGAALCFTDHVLLKDSVIVEAAARQILSHLSSNLGGHFKRIGAPAVGGHF